MEDRFALREGFVISPFREQDEISAEAVMALWEREGVVSAAEGARRVHELVMVARDPAGEVAGVSTAVLDHPAQLGLPLWHYRVFVAPAHRHRAVGVWLVRGAIDHHAARFADGRDHRAVGVVSEMQNRAVEAANPHAHWWEIDMRFAGLTPAGERLRVHYFPGALAPDPPRPDSAS